MPRLRTTPLNALFTYLLIVAFRYACYVRNADKYHQKENEIVDELYVGTATEQTITK
jgi:hypothetical protein